MKPIHECDRLEVLERALLAIEGLTYLVDEMTSKEQNEKINERVYCIAHAATAFCKANHKDWLNLIEETENTLREANIVDVGDVLNRNSPFRQWGTEESEKKRGII